jgi:hypothetical protein
MAGESNPFADWGTGPSADAVTPPSAPPTRGRPAPNRHPGTVVLAVALVVAAVVLVAKLAAIGPFAATSAATVPGSPAVTVEPTVSLPLGQWLATGRVDATQGRSAANVGQQLVRAWFFEKQCNRHVSCHGEFIRQLSGGGADEAEIMSGPRVAFATFSPTTIPCASPAGAEGSEQDSYTFRQSPGDGRLVVNEQAALTGCGNSRASWFVGWNATAVPLAAAPALTANPRHAATAAAFHAAATVVCGRVNAQLDPIGVGLASDGAAINGARPPDLAAARAAAALAGVYPRLVPIIMHDYADVLQPPSGAMDAVWLRYVAVDRRQLPEQLSQLAALAKAAEALSDYERTGSGVAQQRLAAEYSIASADETPVKAYDATMRALQSQLGLPSICTNPPALSRTIPGT